jgi:hypothetical protein
VAPADGVTPNASDPAESLDGRTKTAGTYRLADGTRVSFDEAGAAWAEAARGVLISVAGEYNSVITYAELAEAIQLASGIRANTLVMHWVGGVLGRVSRQSALRDEPLISALCVHRDGTVGDGYAVAVAAARGVRPADPDEHAAQERLRCHRAFGAELPPGGGQAALTSQVAARRRRRALPALVTPPAVCPIHNTVLPASGRCDDCG